MDTGAREHLEGVAREAEPKPTQLKVAIFDDPETGNVLKEVMSLFDQGKGHETIGDEKELIERAEKGLLDVAVFSQLKQENIRTITKIRNNPEIKQQPIIIVVASSFFDRRYFNQAMEAGADVGLPIHKVVFGLLTQYADAPEMLANLEDQYADKMVINKKRFYKEHQDKLRARSEITADTEQELKMLKSLFESNDVKAVLDAGGGAGRLAIPLAEAGYEVANADGSAELLEQMQEQSDQATALETDLRKLPLENKSFDAVTFNWHVFCDIMGNKSKRQVLSEAHRVLKDGGVLSLDIPNRLSADEMGQTELQKDGVYMTVPRQGPIFVGYVPSAEEIKTFLKEAGFNNIQTIQWKTKKGFPKLTFTAKK